MSDLVEKIQQITNFGRAIQDGLEKTIQSLPIITKQQINAKARNRLNSTLEPYMDGIQTRFEDFVFIIEIDKSNWMANAVESGVSPFDMKQGFFNSKRAKTSKEGHKYLSVPIQKDAKRKASTMGTQKAQEYQNLINHVMRKPKFGGPQLKHGAGGTVIEMQKLITDEPKLQGFYRFRKHESSKAFYSGRSRGAFQHVMFRTVSEKGSKTGATWEHPGIKPVNILREIERELPQIFETLLDNNIRAELQALL